MTRSAVASRNPIPRAFVGLLFLATSAFGATAPKPNIVLITMDTTRADRMGFLGSQRGLTPNLDRLAAQSVVFTHAYSQAPLTPPSHATILTGTYPQFHQVADFRVPLAEDLPYAPAILKAHGYHTAAFIGAMVLDPSLGLAVGFDRGFDTYDANFHAAAPGEDRHTSVERRGVEVVDHALAWLSSHRGSPFFIWIHIYDAHSPYDPPEPYKSKYKSAPYDGEIAYADSAIGKLLGQLRIHGLYEQSLIAIMADHGESLGDHGEEFHGFFLYDETIHVPLLFKLPGERLAGARIDRRVGLVDVLPTILETAHIRRPSQEQGESLVSIMKSPPTASRQADAAAEKATERPMYAETQYALRAYGWSPVRSLRTGKYLFVDVPRRELYDLAADPGQEHDLAAHSRAVADTLAAQLSAFRQKTATAGEAPKPVADPGVQEKLAALGYVAGNDTEKESNVTGADPKDKIEIGNLSARANSLLEEWKLDEGVSVLQQAIAKEPNMESLYTKLGIAQTMMGKLEDAVKTQRKAVELTPDSMSARYNLAKGLVRVKDFDGAIAELNVVVAKLPDYWPPHMALEIAYFRTNRLPETIRECEKVLSVLPEQYGTNLLLGISLSRSGDPSAGLPKLEKAAEIRPDAPEVHTYLAETYERLGRGAEAAEERAQAEQLGANAQ